jgi:hypothetical protein
VKPPVHCSTNAQAFEVCVVVHAPLANPCAPAVDDGEATCSAARLNRICWPQAEPAAAGDPAHPRVAGQSVFVAEAQVEAMAATVRAVEAVAQTPAWAESALATAPAIARPPQAARGLLYGFDFHLTDAGPRLIEINTNAGGAMISLQVLAAQARCCAGAEADAPAARAVAAGRAILDSFLAEWRAARPTPQPRTLAIIDEQPAAQYLYPEFRLFAERLGGLGIETLIGDPRELEGGAEGLRLAGRPIDMVYNRLTDFYLEAPHLAALRAAYAAGTVLLTPHPHGHALYADKRHLAALSDGATLRRLGVAPATVGQLLATVTPTRLVDRADAEALWQGRRDLFFKPAGAFGGRGAYEGAKLTRGVFQRLLDEPYVAQQMVPPPTRRVWVDGAAAELKYDVRCYAYAGEVQLMAARLYRGQATNFRTPGGGFAAIQTVPA